jgi:hypothetical protein
VPKQETPGSNEHWDEIIVSPADDPLPLLPDGEIVEVGVTECRVSRMFDGSWRATLTCDVLADGQRRYMTTPDGEVLPMRLPLYFKLPSRRGSSGPFEPASRGSKFYRLWVLANNGVKPLRRDRMPLAIFRHRPFRAKTRVVSKNHKGETLPKELQHSVVEEFVL